MWAATFPKSGLSRMRRRSIFSVSIFVISWFPRIPIPIFALPASVLRMPFVDNVLPTPPASPLKNTSPSRVMASGSWISFKFMFLLMKSIVLALILKWWILVCQWGLSKLVIEPFADNLIPSGWESISNSLIFIVVLVPEKDECNWIRFSKDENWGIKLFISEGVI